jgi:hypothetical protein
MKEVNPMPLKYCDLSNNKTPTFVVMDSVHQQTEALRAKFKRAYDFEITLTNYLQSRKVITCEQFNALQAWFDHSNLPVQEIFDRVFIT